MGGTGEGIAFYLPNYQIIDCDIKFVENILPNVTPVKCKNNKIPLSDNFVDIVVSVDMIEHLPTYKKREQAIREMIRIARKKLILAVPTGEKSLLANKKLKDIFQKKYPNKSTTYLDEHLTYGHPRINEIKQMIKSTGLDNTIKVEKNANIKTWLLFQKIYLKFPKLYLIFRHRNFWYLFLKPILPFFDFGETLRTIFYIDLYKNLT